MKSLYVSFGSDFADLEAIQTFCDYNNPEDLHVLLFADCSSAKKLKLSFPKIHFIFCRYTSHETVGFYDHTLCDRQFAVAKVGSFAKYLLKKMSSIVTSTTTPATSDCSKIFVFSESVRMNCDVSEMEVQMGVDSHVDYSACAEVVYPDNGGHRFPSILSGAVVSIRTGLYKNLVDSVLCAAEALPCMKTCSCLCDLILHTATQMMHSLFISDSCVTVEHCEIMHNASTDRYKIRFVDMAKVFPFNRIVTAPFRILPEKNISVVRHAVQDAHCKVGIIATDTELVN